MPGKSHLRLSAWSVAIAGALVLPWTALGAIKAPTDFRTDPSDFFDDGDKKAIFCQFRWTDNADNETGYQFEVSTDGTTFRTLTRLPANTGAIDTASVPWTSVRWF